MARQSVSILEYYAADSPYTTEFRRLLHRLLHHKEHPDIKSILITSAVLSEGKSTVCAMLGATAAHKGLKTLIVDCDLRRPSIHKLFVLPRPNGVADILIEGTPVKAAIKKTNLDKLDIITAGKPDAQPGEIFDARAIGAVLNDLKFFYDLIIVDSPPVIPVSDPMLLASEVDASMLVVKAGSTQREVVSRAVEIMQSSDGLLLGTVLNNVTDSLPAHYDYQHYAYTYDTRPERVKDSGKKKSGGTGNQSSKKSKNRSVSS